MFLVFLVFLGLTVESIHSHNIVTRQPKYESTVRIGEREFTPR